jgi:hypothetical protein
MDTVVLIAIAAQVLIVIGALAIANAAGPHRH